MGGVEVVILQSSKMIVCCMFVVEGKNVKEFFTRVAAICFDQSVLRETASLRENNGKTQLGSGSLIKTNNQSETIGEFCFYLLSTKYEQVLLVGRIFLSEYQLCNRK